jgi:large subunit ribosomal protein L3
MKGVRMSGHMGSDRVTQRGLQIVDADPERNLLLVHGSVPGGTNGIVVVRPE